MTFGCTQFLASRMEFDAQTSSDVRRTVSHRSSVRVVIRTRRPRCVRIKPTPHRRCDAEATKLRGRICRRREGSWPRREIDRKRFVSSMSRTSHALDGMRGLLSLAARYHSSSAGCTCTAHHACGGRVRDCGKRKRGGRHHHRRRRRRDFNIWGTGTSTECAASKFLRSDVEVNRRR